jgi:hypothetical protein
MNNNNNTTTKTTEHNELIATRIPPGDRWTIKNDTKKIIHNSLTDVLEAYFLETHFKGEYRLAPLDSKLYVIKQVQEILEPELPKSFNIYGDPL